MIHFNVTIDDAIGEVSASLGLAAAAQYAEENGLVIVGERGKDGKIVYWFEEG